MKTPLRDEQFCPHCNPCTHDGGAKCRAPYGDDGVNWPFAGATKAALEKVGLGDEASTPTTKATHADVGWANRAHYLRRKIESLRHHVRALQMLVKGQHSPLDLNAFVAKVDAIDRALANSAPFDQQTPLPAERLLRELVDAAESAMEYADCFPDRLADALNAARAHIAPQAGEREP